jgi:hypothetical protein
VGELWVHQSPADCYGIRNRYASIKRYKSFDFSKNLISTQQYAICEVASEYQGWKPEETDLLASVVVEELAALV